MSNTNYLEISDADFNKLTNTFIKKQDLKNSQSKKEITNQKEKEFITYVLENEKIEVKKSKKNIMDDLIISLKNDMNSIQHENDILNENKIIDIINIENNT
jgi:hypothetical protein